MKYSSPYLNTAEGYCLVPGVLNTTEQSSNSHQKDADDSPNNCVVVDYRVRCRKERLDMNDIATICHSFSVRNDVLRPKWFCYTRLDKTTRLLFARIPCSDTFLDTELKSLPFFVSFFPPEGVEVDEEVLNSDFFWNSLMNVNIGKFAQLKGLIEERGDELKRLRVGRYVMKPAKPPPGFVKSSEDREAEALMLASQNVRKVDLLTTMSQMVYLFYPMEGLEMETPAGIPPIMKTKKHYGNVGENSPLFFLDTEMCLTDVDLLELTRVTLLNEKGKTIIDTLVKPHNKIVDYLTFFSGITKEAMDPVTVRLSDVQQAFRRVLPPDAILCGHSIEGDLRALRLSHPYCIDTSYVYNIVKFSKRTSLRGLAYFFLNKRIQCSGKGHCSHQDSVIVSELVRLKLTNNREFGVLPYGFDYAAWARKNGFEKCADFYERSTIKDIAKDECREPKLPEPRVIGSCARCKTSFMSQCFIDDCTCPADPPKFCCFCVGRDLKHPDPPAAKEFMFGKQIEEELRNLSDRSVSLSSCLRKYQRTRVLVARYLKPYESMDEMSTDSMTFVDMYAYDHIDVFKKFILSPHAYSTDSFLLEYNAKDANAGEIDAYLKALYEGCSNHGVIGVLFCGETKARFFSNTKAMNTK